MLDREKVKKALECRKNADKRYGAPCEETGLCHYAIAVRGLDGEIYKPFICDRGRICEDALALLKEQEAVKPRVSSVEQRCGNCNKVIEMDGWIACPWCGKPILWEAVGRKVKWNDSD